MEVALYISEYDSIERDDLTCINLAEIVREHNLDPSFFLSHGSIRNTQKIHIFDTPNM